MKVKKLTRTAAEIDALYEAAKAIYGEIKALGRKTLTQYYALCEKLFELRASCDRTFARAVKEIGVGRSTAYEYINFYERAIERYGQEQLPAALSEFDSFEAAKKGLFPRRQVKAINIGDPHDKNESSGHDSGNDATEGKAPDESKNVSDPKPLNKAAEFGRAKFDAPSFVTKVGHFSKWLAAEQ